MYSSSLLLSSFSSFLLSLPATFVHLIIHPIVLCCEQVRRLSEVVLEILG